VRLLLLRGSILEGLLLLLGVMNRLVGLSCSSFDLLVRFVVVVVDYGTMSLYLF
jgi:hypothetical protein